MQAAAHSQVGDSNYETTVAWGYNSRIFAALPN